MQLPEKFDQLEHLLLNHRESIGIHNGVPFILLIYSPEMEIDCRNKIKNLQEKLESKNLSVLNIPINLAIFDHLKKDGVLDQIMEFDKDSPKEVREDMFKRSRQFLKDYILNDVQKNSPEIVFLTNVSGLYPYYRVSNLLTSLEKEIKIPFVIFYPGEINEDGKLYFMGELESNEYYRAQRI
jgi:hypothetical protein